MRQEKGAGAFGLVQYESLSSEDEGFVRSGMAEVKNTLVPI